ncbi:MAG: hypothetical protein ACYTBS_17840, partial [Planctomycetota bacterium]
MAPRRIRSRKTRSKGRKYSDRRPQFDLCEETIARTRRYGFVGRAVSGFDHYGYPIIRNMNLPAPFAVRQGRQYGAAE